MKLIEKENITRLSQISCVGVMEEKLQTQQLDTEYTIGTQAVQTSYTNNSATLRSFSDNSDSRSGNYDSWKRSR